MNNSNNGDLPRVLATVISIVIDFLDREPQATVFFSGSTQSRTNLYRRVLVNNYALYKERYNVIASLRKKNKIVQQRFDPEFNGAYFGFYVQRKI